MKTFHYAALNKANTYVKGKVQAPSLKQAAAKLKADGLQVVSLKEERVKHFGKFDRLFASVSRLDKIFFTSHLYTLLESGVALDQALRATAEQTNNLLFREILLDIHAHVQRGQALNVALAKHAEQFSNFYVNLVRVGEKTGKLADVLSYLLEQQEKDYELLVKARGAMIYPSIILSALCAMVVFMMVFVIPKITGLLLDYKVKLPLATRVLIAVSGFLIHWGVFLLLALLVAGWFARQWFKTPPGKWFWDGLLFRVPRLKRIIIEFNLARFARAMSSLLKSGVPIDQALELAASVSSNSRYQKSIRDGIGFIQKGIPLTEVLKGYPALYPPVASRMIEVGERTGRLDHMLDRLATFYEKSVTATLGNISSIIEPVLLLTIGLAVGFVAIAILTPIWKFSETI